MGSTCHCPFHSTGHTTSSRSDLEHPARQDRLALLIFRFSSLCAGRIGQEGRTGGEKPIKGASRWTL